jgi:D-serine deaminase-like pyridoxal phosphate-dependent protein
MNEEHGIVTSEKGDTGLHVGDILTLIPNHVCTAINMQNSIYLLNEDETLTRAAVDARGMLV